MKNDWEHKLDELCLDNTEEVDWTIILKVKAWHYKDSIKEYGLPDIEAITDFFGYFIDEGYQDIWGAAAITEVEASYVIPKEPAKDANKTEVS